jgi:hypothetical protein
VDQRSLVCRIEANGQYSFTFYTHFHPKNLGNGTIRMLADRNGPGGGQKPDYYWATQPYFIEGQTYTVRGKCDPGASTLNGTLKVPAARDDNTAEISGGLTITWNLTRKKENLEVVVDIPDYESWIPQAALRPYDPDPGDWPMLVTASLRTKDGSLVKDKAAKFVFELVDVSHEPGVCMNFPAISANQAEPEPDLQFDARLARNKSLLIFDKQGQVAKDDGKGLKAETLPVPDGYTAAEAEVGCYDWGAYGLLLVTAEMPDGRQFVGYLDTDKTSPYIRLPKRKEGSRIADAWKEQWRDEVSKIMEMSDDDDDEDDPDRLKKDGPGAGKCRLLGPKCMGGDKGDGLTLYEEYRGFFVGGKHVYGHPGKKDLFIFNRVGGDSELGVLHFRNLTKAFLEVHDQLQEDEIGPRQIVDFFPEAQSGLSDDATHGLRVWINPNVGHSTPTRGKQYGICLDRSFALPRGWSFGMGHPGLPKKVALNPSINLTKEFVTGDGRVIARDFSVVAVTHEILHCCNVAHHGDIDIGRVQWSLAGTDVIEKDVDDNGNIDPDKRRWRVIPQANIRRELGGSVPVNRLQDWLGTKGDQLYVARERGQHSGYQDCVMRYNVAGAFIRTGLENVRYVNRPTGELVGQSLCDQRLDTAVPSLRLPILNRYGDATNGFCRSQICINDPKHKHVGLPGER